MTVFVVVGWFGDQEWIEGIYTTKESAETVCDKMWEHRESEIGPPESRGVHKFAVEPFEVKP